MPLPQEAQTIFQGILCLIAVLACLYIAQAIVLPVVLAIVLTLLLQPLVNLLEQLRVPKPVGALIALASGSTRMAVLVEEALTGRAELAVPAGVLAQAWRGGGIPQRTVHDFGGKQGAVHGQVDAA